jgi:hypothetical protein
LLYYGARYDDAYLNRWTQPDTLIPNLFDPQSLNRYAYVMNNPVKYTDPSGHCDPDFCTWHRNDDNDSWIIENKSPDEQSVKDAWAQQEAQDDPAVDACARDGCDQDARVEILTKHGRMMVAAKASDADFLIRMTAVAAKMAGSNRTMFVDDLTLAILGWHAEDAVACGNSPSTCGKVVGPGLVNLLAREARPSGLRWEFRDGSTDQVHHFWEYVAISYASGPSITNGPTLSRLGNIYHERGLLQGEPGASAQDLLLGFKGADLGEYLGHQYGPIEQWGPPMDARDVPKWIEDHLKNPNGCRSWFCFR